MQAITFTVSGQITEIVGAFFLSVEAIKLENFRAIRDKMFRRFHHAMQSPRIFFVDDDAEKVDEAIEFNRGVWGARNLKLFLLFHYVAGAALLAFLDYVTGGYLHQKAGVGIAWVLSLHWYYMLLVFFGVLVFGVCIGLWLLGELVHVSITYATSLPIELVDFIDKHTDSGTIGMIGFLLLFLGGLLQIVGTLSAG